MAGRKSGFERLRRLRSQATGHVRFERRRLPRVKGPGIADAVMRIMVDALIAVNPECRGLYPLPKGARPSHRRDQQSRL